MWAITCLRFLTFLNFDKFLIQKMLTKYRADIQNSHKEHFPKNSNEKTLFSFVSKIQIQIQIVARS